MNRLLGEKSNESNQSFKEKSNLFNSQIPKQTQNIGHKFSKSVISDPSTSHQNLQEQSYKNLLQQEICKNRNFKN